MKIDIVNKSGFDLPKYETSDSAGMDLRACLSADTEIFGTNSIILEPGERKKIPTGIYIKLPEGYEAQIRPRSGLAIKNGITVINTPGTIDSDFVLEICVLLVNLSKDDFFIHNGDRIAQMVINKFEKAEWNVVDNLLATNRTGGFGSTGIK